MTKEEIKNGIAGYQNYQQRILNAIERADGELHQEAFDAEFRKLIDTTGPFYGKPLSGDELLLGSLEQGYYGEMLHLAQLMEACDILDIKGEPPNLKYTLKQSNGTHP
jgi:hypothetical protein